MTTTRRACALLVSSAVFCSFAAFAEQPLEQLVVTGSYTSQDRSRLSSTISVVDREAIKQLHKTNVLDVLRTVPGVLVNQEGGAGGQSSVSIRGGESNFTLVLIDGVQVNDPTNTRGGSFNFNSLNINAIERIEIVRGSQSAIYGSDALAGVINIITIEGTSDSHNKVNLEAGLNGYYSAGYRHTGSAGKLAYALNMQRLVSGEQVEGSEQRGSELTGRLGGDLWAGAKLSASIRLADSDRSSFPEQSGGPEFSVSRELDSADSRDLSGQLRIDQTIAPVWDSAVYVNGYKRSDKSNSPGIAPFMAVPPTFFDSDYRQLKAGWLNTLHLSDSLELVLGLDSRWEKGSSKGYIDFSGIKLPSNFELDRQTTGLIADLSWQHASGFVIQGSARQDRPENTDRQRTYKLGSRLPLLDHRLTLFANWGQGFKLPSFFALGNPLVGNPDLKPEKATSADIGIEWRATPALGVTLVAFGNDYKDLVDFDAESFTNVNRSSIKTRGGEFELDWQITAAMALTGQATYTDISSDEDVTLTGRPRWKVGLVYNWQFASAWGFNLDYQWSDDVLATTLYTGDTSVETLGGYHLFNTNLQWQAVEWLRVQVSLDNVFNQSYQEAIGFPGPARLLRIGAVFSF